jgi:hypothetical protein
MPKFEEQYCSRVEAPLDLSEAPPSLPLFVGLAAKFR